MIHRTVPSNPSNSVAAVFAQHSGAEKAVKELKEGGFDVKKLSIIGSDTIRNKMWLVSTTRATG